MTTTVWSPVSTYPPSGVANNPAQIPLDHTLTAADDGLVSGKIYRVRSYASNAFGTSEASSVVEVLTQSAPPQMAAVSNVTAS